MSNWFGSNSRVRHWNPAGPSPMQRAWQASAARKRCDGYFSAISASLPKRTGIDSTRRVPERSDLLGAVVLVDRVVQPLQRSTVAGEITLLLRIPRSADRRLDLL